MATGINRASKRAKLDNEDALTDEEKINFYCRWFGDGDRKNMLHLMKKHKTVAIYSWERDAMQSTSIKAEDLLGDYDVLFIHGVGHGTDQGYVDTGPISRTLCPGAKLSFASKRIEAGDYFYDEGTDVVHGTIKDVDASDLGEVNSENRWDHCVQMNNVEFREFPDDFFGGGRCFCMTKVHGCDAPDEQGCTVQVVTNAGTMNWAPTEMITDDEDDRIYREFMLDELPRRRTYDEWNEQHSWLCRRKGLPAEAVKNILSFNRHVIPPLQFEWLEGDILIEIDMEEYVTSYTVTFLARPCNRELRDHLLEKASQQLQQHSQ